MRTTPSSTPSSTQTGTSANSNRFHMGSGGRVTVRGARRLVRSALDTRTIIGCPAAVRQYRRAVRYAAAGTPITPKGRRPIPAPPRTSPLATWLVALGLAAVTIAAFAEVHRFALVNFDDQVYVTNNPH